MKWQDKSYTGVRFPERPTATDWLHSAERATGRTTISARTCRPAAPARSANITVAERLCCAPLCESPHSLTSARLSLSLTAARWWPTAKNVRCGYRLAGEQLSSMTFARGTYKRSYSQHSTRRRDLDDDITAGLVRVYWRQRRVSHCTAFTHSSLFIGFRIGFLLYLFNIHTCC